MQSKDNNPDTTSNLHNSNLPKHSTGASLPPGTMLNYLEEVKKKLPKLLAQSLDKWKSLDIDYEPPRVERAYQDIELSCGSKVRVNLHRIHACSRAEALSHQHPWASASCVLSGKFETACKRGAFDGDIDLSNCGRQVIDLRNGGTFEWEMNHEFDAHYVRPIDGPIETLFVTTLVDNWNVRGPVPPPLQELDEQAKEQLIRRFQSFFP